MARQIIEEPSYQPDPDILALARMEDVDHDALRKKYMENIKNGGMKKDDRDTTEIQAEYDSHALKDFMEFFSIDIPADDINSEELMAEIDMVNENEIKESLEREAEYREISASDLKIKLASDEEMNTFTSSFEELQKAFEKVNETVIDEILTKSKAEERSSSENSRATNNSSTRSGYERTSFDSGYTRSTRPESTYTNSTKFDPKDREQKRRHMYENTADKMRRMGEASGRNKKEDKSYTRFTRKRKGIKGVLDRAKAWTKSREAALLCKVGLFLCMETALAVISGRYEFDGAGQLLAYLGMMIGVFYIGRELASEGMNPNNFAF